MSDPKIQQNVDWRSIYPVHPCADVFPMMSDAELDALTADIKATGLVETIKYVHIDGQTLLVDGRNRFEAIKRLDPHGLCVGSRPNWGATYKMGPVFQELGLYEDAAIASYVVTANIRRRHLTKEQQAELIVKTIEAASTANIDRAKVARSFNPTNGKKGGSTKDPILEQSVREAKKLNISKRTVQNARAKIQGKPKPTRVTKADVEAQRARTQRVKDDLAAEHRSLVDTINQSPSYTWARAELLGKGGGPARQLAIRVIDVGYKTLARELHPDKGGSDDTMARLNAVRDHLKHCV